MANNKIYQFICNNAFVYVILQKKLRTEDIDTDNNKRKSAATMYTVHNYMLNDTSFPYIDATYTKSSEEYKYNTGEYRAVFRDFFIPILFTSETNSETNHVIVKMNGSLKYEKIANTIVEKYTINESLSVTNKFILISFANPNVTKYIPIITLQYGNNLFLMFQCNQLSGYIRFSDSIEDYYSNLRCITDSNYDGKVHYESCKDVTRVDGFFWIKDTGDLEICDSFKIITDIKLFKKKVTEQIDILQLNDMQNKMFSYDEEITSYMSGKVQINNDKMIMQGYIPNYSIVWLCV